MSYTVGAILKPIAGTRPPIPHTKRAMTFSASALLTGVPAPASLVAPVALSPAALENGVGPWPCGRMFYLMRMKCADLPVGSQA